MYERDLHMKVFVVQLNLTIGNLKKNTKKIIHAIENGRSKGCDIILFPELTICGYPPEDFLFHKNFIESMDECLEQIARSSHGVMVVVGCVRKNLGVGEKPLFNSAAIIQDGKVIGYQDKWLLPTYDVFDERRYFEPGSTTQVWEYKNKKIGVIICEDIWQHAGYVDYTNYHRDPVLELQKHQPDLLLNLSASPYQYQKPDTRVKVCSKASNTLHCPVILCCQVGGNDELVFDGYSVYVDKKGNLAQLGHGFKEDEMVVDLSKEPCSCPLLYDPIGDLYSALVLGVRDYFHKSGFTKGCLGLSGGIDSALVACIAVDALGKENVLGIAMPSRYSSESSLVDARALAQNLHIAYEEVSIEKPFQAFLDTLDPFFAGKGADITEENEQARIRGTILMAFSNKLRICRVERRK
jgi:NAD+ synthase (glutamine-hydrolysing)